MTETTTVRHPYQAGPAPRRLYLWSIVCLLGALAAELIAIVLMVAAGFGQSVVAMAGSLALWAGSRVLRRRAWWSVAWCDQDVAAEPVWLTVVNQGGQLALVASAMAFALSHGPGSGFVALVVAACVTGAAVVLAVQGRRTRHPRWRRWRDVNAVGLAAITIAGYAVSVVVGDPALVRYTGMMAIVFGAAGAAGTLMTSIAARRDA